MALPASNTTCDIYRSGNAPPASPDVPGVKCYLGPKGASTLTTQNYTHVLLLPPTTDVRDDYAQGFVAGANADHVWIPNKNGTRFDVVLVRRIGRGTSLDHKYVLLVRVPGSNVPWPTDNV
jgi:hypothetical protein